MRLLKNLPIDPFACEDYKIEHNLYRLKWTKKLIDEIKEPVLDIGTPNVFGQALAKYINIDMDNTRGDLNFDGWVPDLLGKPVNKYRTVFCFEVIEHLLSPAMFLKRLRDFITDDVVVYITYPIRPHFMWTHIHFHEYDRRRFLYMLDYCGFKVEKYEWRWQRDYFTWRFIFSGIRPLLLRWWIGRARRQYYKLTLK